MVQDAVFNEALVALIGAESEDELHKALVDAIHGLVPGSFVVSSALIPGTSEFRVSATAGLDRIVGPAVKILGLDPLATRYSAAHLGPEDLRRYRTGRLERVPGGLHEVAFGRLPKAACRGVERIAGISSIWAIGLAWHDVHYGGVSIGLRGDARIDDPAPIELLVHMVTIAVRRQHAEAQLRIKTAEIDSFFTESLDLLCIAGTDGHFRRLNPEWERTLGYSVAELEGTPFLDLVHVDDVESTLGAVRQLAAGRAVVKFVNRYRTKDGNYRWLEWRSFPRGDDIYAAARDLTERIEAEQALRRSETRYRFIADNTADVIWLLDVATGRFKYVSPSVERLRGYTPEEVLAQPMEAALTPESYHRVAQALPAVIAAVEAGDIGASLTVDEVDQPCRDGSIVATEVTSRLLTDAEGKVVEILGVSRDITERRAAAEEIKALNESLEARVAERTVQLEQAIAELEAFSYSVSHDLRSPLRAINGYATILRDEHHDTIGENGVALCESIVRSSRRMGQLIDDLIGFARLGRTSLAKEPVDMTVLALGVLDEACTGREDTTLTTEVGSLAPALGDPALLRQVWVNLIDNALKFSGRRDAPRVEVGCRPGDGENIYYVRDNGEGFDMRYVAKLFEVFERLHTGDRAGSGIGLAIVRRIVEAHGGRVWAEGRPEEGATFFFSLPAQPAS